MNKGKFLFFLAWIILCPLAGAWLVDPSFDIYAMFAPGAILIHSKKDLPLQPFSWMTTFVLITFALLLVLLFFMLIFRGLRRQHRLSSSIKKPPFTWWGAVAGVSLCVSWYFAWFRMSELRIINEMIFTLLWFCYIVLINALTLRRSGKCVLLDCPTQLLTLYLISIPFWWYFEYLNRYVHNWFYLFDSKSGAIQYLIFGSLAFGTVLPAVISTRNFILTFSCFSLGFDDLRPWRGNYSSPLATGVLILSSLSLFLIGVFPKYLFFFVWISPLLVLVAFQSIGRLDHIFTPLTKGKYAGLVASALAALLCGSLWEMWNYYSLPKWIYSVPWVNGFRVFEMPLIGYLGYLPFGLECMAIAALLERKE